MADDFHDQVLDGYWRYENLQYQNLLINNHWWIAQQVIEGNDLENTLNRIIELLEQEIALKSKR